MKMKTLPSHALNGQRPVGIAYYAGRLDHILKHAIRDCLTSYGVTPAQYTALSIFRSHKPLSNAQLAERSMVSPQSANEMVKTMEKRGWISRQSASGHGRIIHIQLTEAGERLLDDCDLAVAGVEQAMLANLDSAARQQLHTMLRTMCRNLSAHLL